MADAAVITQWDLAEAERLIEHPAVRLLRSPNASLTLTFLHRAFKEHHSISIPESHLRARLQNFLDEARLHRPGDHSSARNLVLNSFFARLKRLCCFRHRISSGASPH
jgi:hypothetical protein